MPAAVVCLARFLGRAVNLDLRASSLWSKLEQLSGLDVAIARQCCRVIVSGRQEARWLERRGIPVEVVIPLASPSQCPVRHITSVQPRILAPVLNHELTNLASLVRAYRLVKEKYPRAEMSVVAWPSGAEELKARFRDERVNGVSILAADSLTDLVDGFAIADLLLQVSPGGNHAAIVMRALQSGLPVVAADSVWARSFLPTTDWYLPVDADRVRSLADTIIGLVESPTRVRELAAAAVSRATCCGKFTTPVLFDVVG
jgi:glycosyltransferase involved in cell wall biosynthesis